MRELSEIVFVSAVRTPMGKFGGTMKDMKVYDIAAFPIREALKRANVSGDELDDAIIGSCNQHGFHESETFKGKIVGDSGFQHVIPWMRGFARSVGSNSSVRTNAIASALPPRMAGPYAATGNVGRSNVCSRGFKTTDA